MIKQAARTRMKTYISLDEDTCIDLVKRAYVEEGNIGQTNRHYYYKLLGYKAVVLTSHENSANNAYHFVCRILGKARESDTLPWEAVIDATRQFRSYLKQYLGEYASEKMRSALYLDAWRGQQQLEIYVEKEAMATLVNGFVRHLRIPVNVNKGYSSITALKAAAERYGNGKGWTLLYIGDFDPSGLDIDRSMREVLRKYGARPNIVRIALDQEDTVSLIPNAGLSLKKSDTRYKKFIEMYGERQQAYEIDSLPAHLLKERVLEYVNMYVDIDRFKAVIELEDAIDDIFTKKLRGTLDPIVTQILQQGLPNLALSHSEQLRYLLSAQGYERATYNR